MKHNIQGAVNSSCSKQIVLETISILDHTQQRKLLNCINMDYLLKLEHANNFSFKHQMHYTEIMMTLLSQYSSEYIWYCHMVYIMILYFFLSAITFYAPMYMVDRKGGPWSQNSGSSDFWGHDWKTSSDSNDEYNTSKITNVNVYLSCIYFSF